MKVPLSVNSVDGPYVLTKTFDENAKQNVKMIVLTEKGENISDINFGCGLKAYLFEPASGGLGLRVEEEIREQIAFYAPYVVVNDVQVNFSPEGHYLAVLINYTIPTTNSTVEDIFEVTA
jgi:phage baseplate assembly protein W